MQLYKIWLRVKENFTRKSSSETDVGTCQFRHDKPWFDLQFHNNGHVKKPEELEDEMIDPPEPIDENILNRICGSLVGMAIGDSLGAHVEFHPHDYLLANPVKDLHGGGTWGLKEGQFTDDTSMALCLGISLVNRQGFEAYDQLVRFKWWYEYGYMSSTGECFDIGETTRQSIEVFQRRQLKFAKKHHIRLQDLDYLTNKNLLLDFPVDCSAAGAAGNGALMRLAPVPLFFHQHPPNAVCLSGFSGKITHGDERAFDACRYFGALICATFHGYDKEHLLSNDFYNQHKLWFGEKPLCAEIQAIARGSYKKKGGYDEGIRGKGYIVNALEAALWAFWSDENSFEKGALAAVNLGDDTDTTAAIYGQLAGAYYGYDNLPQKWAQRIYAKKFILNLSKWLAFESACRNSGKLTSPSKSVHGFMKTTASVDNLLTFSQNNILSYSTPNLECRTQPLRRKLLSPTALQTNNLTVYCSPVLHPRSSRSAQKNNTSDKENSRNIPTSNPSIPYGRRPLVRTLATPREQDKNKPQ